MADLIKQLSDLTAKGPAGLEEADRLAILQATSKLTDALENPIEKFLRLFFVCQFSNISTTFSLSLYLRSTHNY